MVRSFMVVIAISSCWSLALPFGGPDQVVNRGSARIRYFPGRVFGKTSGRLEHRSGCLLLPRSVLTLVSVGGAGSAQRPERGAKFLREKLRFLPGREMPTRGGLMKVDEVRVDLLDPALRGLEDLIWKNREADRE